MYAIDHLARLDRDLEALTWTDAILIGVAQAFALCPGVSRSGITMMTGLAVRLDRESAARYSFLLSIPVIGGAAAYKGCLLYTSDAADDLTRVDLGGRRIIKK